MGSTERPTPREIILPTLSLFVLYLTLTGAFSREIAFKIKERDKRCVNCGRTSKLEASHKDHTRNEWYNDPETGETLCCCCHYQYHLDARGKAHSIGLTESQNEWSIKSIWGRMSRSDKAGYPPPGLRSKAA